MGLVDLPGAAGDGHAPAGVGHGVDVVGLEGDHGVPDSARKLRFASTAMITESSARMKVTAARPGALGT